MKVDSLLLGHFVNSSDDRHPFYLYRLKDSTMLLFKLVDVCSFFNLPELPVSSLPAESYCDEQQDIYLSTPALTQVAIKHNKFLLAELCKLKPSDYAANLADSILSTMPSLECSKDFKKNSYNETDISISPISPTHHPVKSEPLSPPPPPPPSATNNNTTIRKSDPMALDSMLTHNTNGAGSQSRKQSRPIEDISNTTSTPKKQRLDEERHLLPKPVHTVSSQQAPPTLLAKRLSGKNARKLTIYAPSYNEQFQAGIRSAPLNSNFRQQQQQKKQPHPLSHQTVPKQKRKAEFAIPPIVPSQQQQQPPHTAHHFPRSPLFHHPTSAFAHSFPITSGRIKEGGPPTSSSSSSSSTSSSATSVNAAPALNNSSAATTATPLCQTPPSSLQRQQFMQPFEHLFDTIETTRSLKSTLDDQIRRSSTLIQTLQASSTTIEGLIRNHVKEIQKESMSKMDDKLMELSKRITALETGKRLIVNPPTIVKSQNDINPKE
ncbi:hypothetical protein K501DRAFT_337656, partial [Backusella circina FSU 941]